MDSKHNPRLFFFAFVAAAISAAAFYFSLGLQPRWWPICLAALPVLWIAPRIDWPTAAAAAFLARAVGGMSLWNYYSRLHIPLWLRLEMVLAPAIAFCGGALLYRGFIRRGRPWRALLVFPATIAGYEYLVSLSFGTFGTTAYTQLHDLPVLQLGALTGLWGISFAVMLLPAMMAATLLSAPRERRALVLGAAAIFGCTLGYGALRLWRTPPPGRTIPIGLAASDLPKNIMPQDDGNAMRLMAEYAEQVKLLAQRGVEIVVLPEMTAVIRDSVSAEVDQLFEETARTAHVRILLGVLHVASKAAYNEARLYSAAGTRDAVYRKQHLVPVLEGSTTPGDEISVLPSTSPSGTIGLEICRDMDYPNPARRYGKADAGLLLVPAWDFDIDRFWHGHMAVFRGVENGFTIVRAAKQGLLTVSDDRGRILAEARTTAAEPFTTLVASVPMRHDATLYQMWGDWFAWLDLALFAGLAAELVYSYRRARIGSSLAARRAGT